MSVCVCTVKVHSKASDLFMSQAAIVNFSTGFLVERPTQRPCVCARVHARVCVCVCVSHNCQSRERAFLLPRLLHSPPPPSSPPSPPLHVHICLVFTARVSSRASFIHLCSWASFFPASCQRLLFKNEQSRQVKENKLNTSLPCWCSASFPVCAHRRPLMSNNLICV